MRIYIVFILICIGFGCNEKALPVPNKNVIGPDIENSDKSDFDLIWSNDVNSPLIGRAVFVYEQGVVFFTQEAKQNARDQIISFDKASGDTLWIWSGGAFYTNFRHIRDNILYFTAGTSIFAVDCLSGLTLWEYEPPIHLAYITLHVTQNKILVSYQNRKQNPLENETLLFELTSSGQAKQIFSIQAKSRGGYTFNFDHITIWTNQNGEEILFCESRSWNYGPLNTGKAEYMALNITVDTIYHDWGNLFNDIDIGGKAYLDESILYISSGWNKVAAIDLATKMVKWKVELPHNYASADLMPVHVLHNTVFISLGNFGRLNVLEASTGNEIMLIDTIGTEWFATCFKNYSGLAWFTTTSGLYAIDEIGKIHLSLKNYAYVKDNVGNFTNAFTIDNPTGLMYAVRGSAFICFKKA